MAVSRGGGRSAPPAGADGYCCLLFARWRCLARALGPRRAAGLVSVYTGQSTAADESATRGVSPPGLRPPSDTVTSFAYLTRRACRAHSHAPGRSPYWRTGSTVADWHVAKGQSPPSRRSGRLSPLERSRWRCSSGRATKSGTYSRRRPRARPAPPSPAVGRRRGTPSPRRRKLRRPGTAPAGVPGACPRFGNSSSSATATTPFMFDATHLPSRPPARPTVPNRAGPRREQPPRPPPDRAASSPQPHHRPRPEH